MAAATGLLTALVALALTDLRAHALIDQCTISTVGTVTDNNKGIWKVELDVVTLQKFIKLWQIDIPSNLVCPTPVGVVMRVCDYPWTRPLDPPLVKWESLNKAYVLVKRNSDPMDDDFLKVTVYCEGVPYIKGISNEKQHVTAKPVQ